MLVFSILVVYITTIFLVKEATFKKFPSLYFVKKRGSAVRVANCDGGRSIALILRQSWFKLKIARTAFQAPVKMELGCSVAIDRLEIETHSELKHLRDSSKIVDSCCHKVLTITHKYQTKVGLRNCRKVTQDVFDRLGECSYLRFCDLLNSRVHSIEALRATTRLLELNLRYTNVADLRPISELPLLRSLDCGSTPVKSCDCLASLGGLGRLMIDDTEISSIDRVAEECQNLKVREWQGPRRLEHVVFFGNSPGSPLLLLNVKKKQQRAQQNVVGAKYWLHKHSAISETADVGGGSNQEQKLRLLYASVI